MSSFKIPTLSDHAFPMCFMCTPKLHNSICAHPPWVSMYASAQRETCGLSLIKSCEAFLQTQIFKSNSVELRHSMEHGGDTGFYFGSDTNAMTDYCLCEPPDPLGLELAQRVFGSPCIRPAGSFSPHVSSLGISLKLRCAVFQHAVGDITGTKVWFVVTFFIKGINSPSNNLNAFSWPLLHIVPGEGGKANPVRIMTKCPRNL